MGIAIRMEHSSLPRNNSFFLFLWIFFSSFVVYGTLIPFNWVASITMVSTNISDIVWVPFIDSDGSRASIPDILQNVLLFIPFGFCGFIVLRPGNRNQLTPIILRLCLVTILGLGLSATVEILQLLVKDRVTSVTDLLTNSSGAAIGALLAHTYFETLQRVLRSPKINGVSRSPTFYPFMLSTIVVTIGALQPFDLSIDIGRIGSRVLGILRNPFDFSLIVRDEPFLFFRYLLFGYICSLWITENAPENGRLKAVIFSGCTTIFLESCQIFTNSHVPGLQDTLVMVSGSILGALFLPNVIQRTSPSLVCAAVVIATFTTSGLQVLSPFRFSSDYQGMNFVPFLPYYERNFITALGMFIEGILIFFPMGFILRLLLPRTIKYVTIIGVIGLVIAAAFEIIQGWVVGRYPDITDVLGAVVGTFAGAWCAGAGWEMFDRTFNSVTMDEQETSILEQFQTAP